MKFKRKTIVLIAVLHLLVHTSGLPAYTNANTLKEQFKSPCPDKVIEKICSLQAANPPGEGYRYSCLGCITLAKIVEIISGKTILSTKAVGFPTQPQSHGRAYGFDVSSGYSWIKGDFASDDTFCHSGYTGTSIVCDPVTGVFVIILAKHAHPHDKGTVRPVRTKVVDIAFEAFEGR
jgi:CubicO group peptidase (beta-lactamase class C family)